MPRSNETAYGTGDILGLRWDADALALRRPAPVELLQIVSIGPRADAAGLT